MIDTLFWEILNVMYMYVDIRDNKNKMTFTRNKNCNISRPWLLLLTQVTLYYKILVSICNNAIHQNIQIQPYNK